MILCGCICRIKVKVPSEAASFDVNDCRVHLQFGRFNADDRLLRPISAPIGVVRRLRGRAPEQSGSVCPHTHTCTHILSGLHLTEAHPFLHPLFTLTHYISLLHTNGSLRRMETHTHTHTYLSWTHTLTGNGHACA